MTTYLIQSTAGSVTVFLQTTAGAAATGLVYTDVTVDIKKTGASSFSNKALVSADFADLGNGFYEIDLSTTDTNTLGNLWIRVTGATIRSTVLVAYVAESAAASPPTTISLDTVVLSGFVTKPDGSPEIGASVQARVLSQPTILKPDANAVAISTGTVSVKTDNDGYFTISLLPGAQVDIAIPAANYRRTLTVPSTGMNLFDIE